MFCEWVTETITIRDLYPGTPGSPGLPPSAPEKTKGYVYTGYRGRNPNLKGLFRNLLECVVSLLCS